MNATHVGPVVVLVVAGLAGCQPPGEMTRVESGSRVVLEPDAVIGEVSGEEAYNLGDIRSVAVDDAGRVYVGDRIGATVRVYSAAGELVREIAREGEGPGEVQGWPADLTFDPAGQLYVRHAARVAVFAPSGEQGIPDSLASEWRVAGHGNLTYSRSRVGNDGTYYYPSGIYRPNEPAHFYYDIYRDGRLSTDTLDVPYYDGMEAQRSVFYRIGAGDGRMVEGLNHVPFAAVPSWDVTSAGTVLSTSGRGAHLLESDLHGDTVRVLELDGSEARGIPQAERADSLRSLEARIDSLPVRLEDVVNLGKDVAERRLPERLPTILSVHVAGGGLIWVERWPDEGLGDARFYDVFDATGRQLASIRLNAPLLSEPSPFFGRRAVVGVTRDVGTGVHRVVRFNLDGIVRQP